MPITHEWNGTILTITSDSGSSSCDLKGEKGDDGARGPQGAACVIAADTQKLDGKDAKYYIQPYNHFDNSYFVNPVNQRGLTTYSSSGGYTIDRWVMVGNGLTIVDNGITIAEGTYLQQRFITGLYDTTKKYTSAIYYNDGSINVSNTQIKTSSSGFDFVNINPIANKLIKAVALYEGEYTAENIPPYVPKGYTVEWVECRRYLEPIPERAVLYGFTGSSGTVNLYIPTPYMKPTKTPTVINGDNVYIVIVINDNYTSLNNWTINNYSDGGVRISTATTITPYKTAITAYINTQDTKMFISNEL